MDGDAGEVTGGYSGFMEWLKNPNFPDPPTPDEREPLWRVEPAHTEIRELALAVAAEVNSDHGVAVKVWEWERFDKEKCAYLLPVEAEGKPGEVWITANHIIMYCHNMRTKETDSFSSFCLDKLEACIREQLTRFAKGAPREGEAGGLPPTPLPHPLLQGPGPSGAAG